MTGRKKPYLEEEISRVKCSRCKQPGAYQWQVCANGNRYVAICPGCDIELNQLVLEFMRIPRRNELMDQYVQAILKEKHP